MPYNEELASQIRRQLTRQKDVTEKKMFGGVCFLVNGNMCCGVANDDLVVRVGPDSYEGALEEPFVRPMDFTGKPLKGFIYVSQEGDLKEWVRRGLAFTRSLPKK